VVGDGGDDEVVVVALGEAGEDDGADAGVADAEGEASAVGGEVGEGEAVAGFEGLVVELKLAADGVGAAVEVVDGVALAANPVGLAGGCARGGAGEEEMVGEFDLDGAAGVAGVERGAEEVAESPGGVGVEGGEVEEGFLLGEDVEVLRGVWGGVHDAVLRGLYGNWRVAGCVGCACGWVA
jgi:hypothetical protein